MSRLTTNCEKISASYAEEPHRTSCAAPGAPCGAGRSRTQPTWHGDVLEHGAVDAVDMMRGIESDPSKRTVFAWLSVFARLRDTASRYCARRHPLRLTEVALLPWGVTHARCAAGVAGTQWLARGGGASRSAAGRLVACPGRYRSPATRPARLGGRPPSIGIPPFARCRVGAAGG